MGVQKHRTSGIAPKSPRLRYQMKLDAERDEKKRQKSVCKYSSVSEAVRREKHHR